MEIEVYDFPYQRENLSLFFLFFFFDPERESDFVFFSIMILRNSKTLLITNSKSVIIAVRNELELS